MEKVILVDENDKNIGLEEKVKAHLDEGKLHRAFADFIFNKKGELLIQQRSEKKMLWPLIWDNTCASHPRENESYEKAGERRLLDELGFTCKLKMADKFQYHAAYKDVGAESEVCATLIGEYDGDVKPVKEEVADWKWVNINDLKKDMEENPDKYTPWFIIALERLESLNTISN
ncbi:TPA: isopentenyl-diphosphate delta-isomerase [candidate division CPR2 bacterium]|uniref:Isopentenyl-diphosphate delta-isomerase n=1 Tax=candidate division CPR2 bacterium GW2011_GWC1_41_48 TaxID=1618344 RepID=A0A0G0W834_UNCC2|nr:MAG: Isopentenyl-diphosphate Delta-isomerase [candidate division CPR2 bacterium GW2011_GWC2_39_35]KKR28501.1 MAG: Isopentenyl-diphosphate Delta-isomerase [candidate division CPR2 bacterium GW2011_GWD1_39_7]KKR29212.1 MAG: Isopentenyl-diphosphate Delta-isomerase [candidate division CPR2 bacterium GW2011_GWD2_39_7]KKS09144.1 MAG: Isopentenyl-diphosphate Delta-isomerase [candidate division CPR2 bacterium GW2011_GWC1_41_48]OGB60971.1 MAG: isopentenyl-diphosphate delta-isomerase [candidate divisi